MVVNRPLIRLLEYAVCCFCYCQVLLPTALAEDVPPPSKILRPLVISTFSSLEGAMEACPSVRDSNMMLTAAFGMEPSGLCAAVRSWKQFAPTTHIVVFVDRLNAAEMRAALEDATNVHVVEVKVSPELGSHWSRLRHFVMDAFMDLCGSVKFHDPTGRWTGGIVVSDSRDAVLQDNIWENPHMVKAISSNSVIFTIEGNPTDNGELHNITVKDEGWNHNNVRTCYMHELNDVPGAKGITYDMLSESPISNVGVTMGAAKAVVGYLASMARLLEAQSEQCWKEAGSDQAAHIYLLAMALQGSPLPFNTVAMANGASPAYHSGLAGPISTSDDGTAYVERGSYHFTPSIMHQYNRHEKADLAILRAYECNSAL